MFDNINLFTWIIASLMGTGFGFGVALLVSANILSKSNNYGDYVGDSTEYSSGAHYRRRIDGISSLEKTSFLTSNYEDISTCFVQPSDFDEVHCLTDEEREKYDKPKPEGAPKYAPAYNETENEFEQWEQSEAGSNNSFNPFKPI